MQDQTCSTVLDPLETIAPLGIWSDSPPIPNGQVHLKPFGSLDDTPCTTFRHSGWAPDRDRVLQALRRTEQPQGRIRAFCHCGSHAYVLRNIDEPGRYRIAGSTCHDRFCVPCATERSRQIGLNCVELIGNTRVRFITLTLRQTDIGLRSSIDRLMHSFKLLQRSKLWRRSVTGGIGFMEVKQNPDTHLWNVHLHLLCTGKYILRDSLSAEWLRCTGDSFVVHIMLPRGHRAVIRYVSKYASKPLNSSFLHDEGALDEAILALKGRRLCTTFGGWRGVLAAAEPTKEAWENVGTLDHWIDRALHGDQEALTILTAIDQAASLAVLENHPTIPRPPPPDAIAVHFIQPNIPGLDDVRSIIGF